MINIMLQARHAEAQRFRKYIDQLLGEVLKQTESIQSAVMNGLPRLQQDEPVDPVKHSQMSVEELVGCIDQQESDNSHLEAYINEVCKWCLQYSFATVLMKAAYISL